MFPFRLILISISRFLFQRDACRFSSFKQNSSHLVCSNEGIVSAKNVWKLPNSKEWLLPPITPDPNHPGHYKTMQQLMDSEKFSATDAYLQDLKKGSCSKCRLVLICFFPLSEYKAWTHISVWTSIRA